MKDLYLRYLENPPAAVSYVKEQSTYLAAVCFDQDPESLPVFTDKDYRPGGKHFQHRGILGPGWVYRRCKRWMSSTRAGFEKRVSRGLDMLMSKTGRGRVPDSMIEGTLQTHFEGLTTTEGHIPDLDSPVENLFWGGEGGHRFMRGLAVLEVLEQSEQIVGECFKGRKFTPGLFMPSSNASFDGSRRNGGCFGALLSSWKAWVKAQVTPEEFDAFRHSVDVCYVRADVGEDGLEQQRTVPIPGEAYVGSFLQFIEERLAVIIDRNYVNAEPVAIPEPDKVRVITKGDPEVAYATLCLQKFMHSTLRGYPGFQFIGQPIEQESWEAHFGDVPSDWYLQSGDYKNATDNLSPVVSEGIWQQICEAVHLPDGRKLSGTPWERLGRLALTGHLLLGPRTKGVREKRQQVWGQLMGSPMSFPILCIANFAASTLALGFSLESVLVRPGPLVVNGDDLGAAFSDLRALERWSLYVSAIGMRPSLGKNYISKRMLIMNSECWVRTRVGESNFWARIGGLNQAALFSTERKGQEAGKDLRPGLSWWDLGERCRELLADVPLTEQRCWRKWFLDYHWRILKQMPPGVSRYLCPQLGGAGIPFLEGDAPPSRSERQAAALNACQLQDSTRGVAFPRTLEKSLLERWNLDCETHFARVLPSKSSERPAMDLVLEEWGFPIQREKTNLGAMTRLAWILSQSIFEETPEIGRVEPNKRFLQQRAWLQRKLTRTACTAKRRVCLTEHATLEFDVVDMATGESEHYGQCNCDYHLMSVEKLTEWRPPEEIIISWSRLVVGRKSLIRTGSLNAQEGARTLYDAELFDVEAERMCSMIDAYRDETATRRGPKDRTAQTSGTPFPPGWTVLPKLPRAHCRRAGDDCSSSQEYDDQVLQILDWLSSF